MEFKIIEGFSKYERSGTIVRNVKNKGIVSHEKGSIRLYNDAGDRVTINKADFEEKLPLTDQVSTEPSASEKTKSDKPKIKLPSKKEANPAKKAVKKAAVKKPAKKAAKKSTSTNTKKRDGSCAKIREMFLAGKTRDQIVAAGYNKHTVYIQTKKAEEESKPAKK